MTHLGISVGSVLLFVLVSATGCATTPKVEGAPMPFHVAIVPISNPTIRAPEIGEDFEATEIRWEPDLLKLSSSVADALAERCFVKTTLLESVEDEDPDRRRQRLVAAARAVGADLVCELDLKYVPTVYRYRLGAPFWANVFLWGVGGPLSYWVKDHTYYARVDLDAEFFDLEAVDRNAGFGGSEAAMVVEASASFQQTAMSFVDRAGSVGPYLLSIVWPAPLLSLDNDEIGEELDEAVQTALLEQLTGEVLSDRGTVLSGGRGLTAIRVDPNDVQVVRLSGGGVDVRGTIWLEPATGGATRISGFELVVGGEVRIFEIDRGEGASGGWAFAGQVENVSDADAVQLVVIAGVSDVSKRTFTFPIP